MNHLINKQEIKSPIKSKNKVLSILSNALFYLFLIVLLYSGITARINNEIPTIFGYSFMHVISESMEPYIMTDDLAIGKVVKQDEAISVGDVYIYRHVDDEMKIIHRIIEIDNNGNYIFKGDNNNAPDYEPVERNRIIFKYQFKIPQFGKVILIMQDIRTYLVLGLLYLIYFSYQIIKTKKQIKKIKIDNLEHQNINDEKNNIKPIKEDEDTTNEGIYKDNE